MLFARGHLNLYLSPRISLPLPFVHLSSSLLPFLYTFLPLRAARDICCSTTAKRQMDGHLTEKEESRGGSKFVVVSFNAFADRFTLDATAIVSRTFNIFTNVEFLFGFCDLFPHGFSI